MPETDNIAITLLIIGITALVAVVKILWSSREALLSENKQLWKDTAVREMTLEAHMRQQLILGKMQLKGQKLADGKLDILIEASK